MVEAQEAMKESLENIVERLSAEDSDERRRAVYELEGQETEQILSHLVRAIQDENRAVREAASEILETLPAEHCAAQLTPLLGSERIEVRNVTAAVLVRYGESAVKELIEALRDENEDVRKFSADILGLARNPEAVPELCRTSLEDDVATVAVSAVEALGKIGDSAAHDTLVEILQSGRGMKAEAAEAIGLIADPGAAKVLMSNLDDPDPIIAYAIVDALGNLGSADTLEPLQGMLAQAPDFLEEPICQAVLKIGYKTNSNVLETGPQRMSSFIMNSIDEESEELLPLVQQQLQLVEGEDFLRAWFEHSMTLPASIVVTMIRKAAQLSSFDKEICGMVDHPDEWVGYTALETIPMLASEMGANTVIDTLKNSSGLRLIAAIKTARVLQLEAAVEILETLLEDENEDVRYEAESALNSIKA